MASCFFEGTPTLTTPRRPPNRSAKSELLLAQSDATRGKGGCCLILAPGCWHQPRAPLPWLCFLLSASGPDPPWRGLGNLRAHDRILLPAVTTLRRLTTTWTSGAHRLLMPTLPTMRSVRRRRVASQHTTRSTTTRYARPVCRFSESFPWTSRSKRTTTIDRDTAFTLALPLVIFCPSHAAWARG